MKAVIEWKKFPSVTLRVEIPHTITHFAALDHNVFDKQFSKIVGVAGGYNFFLKNKSSFRVHFSDKVLLKLTEIDQVVMQGPPLVVLLTEFRIWDKHSRSKC